MKIAYFIGTLKEEDGVSRVLLRILAAAKSRRFETLIVTGQAERPKNYPTEILLVPSLRFPLYREYALPLPIRKNFEERLDAFRPDLIHFHSPDPIVWPALQYARQKSIPTVATHHTDFIKYLPYYHLSFLEPILWFYLRKIYNRTNLITTPSDVITETLQRHGIKNAVTVPNGVDLENFNPRFRSQSATPVILTVSRLVWEKDLKTLISVYRLLEKNKNKVILAVAGAGPARKELEKAMPRAKFLGHLAGQKLATAYASADVFLFPSTTETFGNVTIEAMASGLVPVAADAGGSKFIIQHQKSGLLAKPKDADDFYQKVVYLLKNPETRKEIRKNALNRSKEFSWEKVLANLFEHYQKLTELVK